MSEPVRIELPEVEVAVNTLLDHLRAWLLVQREWPLLMAGADRQTRKRVAGLIAHELTTIPAREYQGEEYVPNRGARRRIMRELERAERAWWREDG